MRQKCGVGLRHVHAKTILTAETRDGAGQCDQLRSLPSGSDMYIVKHPGGAGTHRTRYAGHTRAHKGTRITQTNLTTSQTHQHTTRTSARRPKPRSVLYCAGTVCVSIFIMNTDSILSSQNEGEPLLRASNDSSLDARIASGIGQRRGGTNMGDSQCPRGAPGHGEHVARTSRF